MADARVRLSPLVDAGGEMAMMALPWVEGPWNAGDTAGAIVFGLVLAICVPAVVWLWRESRKEWKR